MTTGVYQITCLENGKRYVGSSANVETRWSAHRWDLKVGNHHNVHLQRCWNKYGAASLRFEILEETTEDGLRPREQWYIDATSPELNIVRDVFEPPLKGKTLSPEQRERLSKALTGRKMSEAQKLATSIRMRDRSVSAETRAKMSAAKLGRKLSDETRAKMSATRKGRGFSPCAIAKASASRQSDEYRQRMAEKTRAVWAKRKEASSNAT